AWPAPAWPVDFGVEVRVKSGVVKADRFRAAFGSHTSRSDGVYLVEGAIEGLDGAEVEVAPRLPSKPRPSRPRGPVTRTSTRMDTAATRGSSGHMQEQSRLFALRWTLFTQFLGT
ncbi:unnamed protein product, partial [Polarella glacialis]